MSVRDPGSLSRSNGAQLVSNHFSRGWRLMKIPRSRGSRPRERRRRREGVAARSSGGRPYQSTPGYAYVHHWVLYTYMPLGIYVYVVLCSAVLLLTYDISRCRGGSTRERRRRRERVAAVHTWVCICIPLGIYVYMTLHLYVYAVLNLISGPDIRHSPGQRKTPPKPEEEGGGRGARFRRTSPTPATIPGTFFEVADIS